MAPFHLLYNIIPCDCKVLRNWNGMLMLLCLNCTNAMCGNCLYSNYYSTPVPLSPSLCLQYCQITTVPCSRGLRYYCTLHLHWTKTAYITLHLIQRSFLLGTPQNCQYKYIKISFILIAYTENCNGELLRKQFDSKINHKYNINWDLTDTICHSNAELLRSFDLI